MTIYPASGKWLQTGAVPVQLIAALAVAAAAFGAGWTVQGWRYDKQISDIHAKQAVALIEAQRQANETTAKLQQQADEAQREHARRVADIRSDATRARGVADRLRNDLDTARATLPSATCSAARDYAATVNELFGECTATAGRLAEAADGHAADALMLQQAWPVK